MAIDGLQAMRAIGVSFDKIQLGGIGKKALDSHQNEWLAVRGDDVDYASHAIMAYDMRTELTLCS
jgi:hypothetical protein